VSGTDGEQAVDHRQDPLDWIRENRGQVKALANSNRRTADVARAVLDYLNSDGGRDVG
jgi:hypothetical protein